MIAWLWRDKNKERILALGGRAVPDYLRSLVEFQCRFPDGAARTHYRADQRWPKGFQSPACGPDRAWAPGVYHGLRAPHFKAYLDEFVFRFNPRRSRHAALQSLLGIASMAQPVTYKMLLAPEAME